MHIKPFILFILLLASCKSSLSIQDNPPAPIVSAYYYEYVSGQAKGSRGYEINIQLEDSSIQLDSVHFMSLKAVMLQKGNAFVARFSSNTSSEMLMAADPKDEYGNQLPSTKPNPPTKSGNHCTVRYAVGRRSGYFKINNLEKRPTVYYPGTPNLNDQ